MLRNRFLRAAVVLLVGLVPSVCASGEAGKDNWVSPYAAWKNGPDKSQDYFPIAVWLQSPGNAARYQALGINVYVALWRGPTDEQVAELKKHGISLVCSQNKYGLSHLDEKTIVGWMHGDEPDNAQSQGQGKGYGPPIKAEKIIADYERIKSRDPSRPVMLNLGQGVAWDGWYGRGVRTNHPEDYTEYVKGSDVVSFDIYPAVHDHPAVAGKLWYVPYGVERLRKWTGGQKPVWDCIECTHIDNPKTKPTPEQVKAEVWMSIIHGSRGLIYFCHQFKPTFIEAGLLADEQMAKSVGAVNHQIHRLAGAINSPAVVEGVKVEANPAEVSKELAKALSSGPIAVMARKHQDATYVFSVRMESSPAKATFTIPKLSGKMKVEVLGEDRTLEAESGKFTDQFPAYGVHLYKIQ